MDENKEDPLEINWHIDLGLTTCTTLEESVKNAAKRLTIPCSSIIENDDISEPLFSARQQLHTSGLCVGVIDAIGIHNLMTAKSVGCIRRLISDAIIDLDPWKVCTCSSK